MKKIPLLMAAMPAAILSLRAEGAPQNPAQVIQALQSGFEEFKATHIARIDALEGRLAVRSAAERLNGNAGGPRSGASRTAIEAFGRFGITGSAEAMQALLPSAAMRTSSDPDGGYLVPEEVSGEILLLQRDISPMRRLARVQPTRSGDYSQVISTGAAASGWVAEGEERPETAGPKLSKITFPAGEVYAMPAVTQQLLDDSDFDVGQYVIGEISREFDLQEGGAFITGNGIKKPRGVLSYNTFEVGGAETFGQIGYVKSGNGTQLADADKLIDVLQSMKAGHRRNATWLMNSKTQGVVSKLKDSNGDYLWRQALIAGTPDTLLGRPVELDENMPDIGAGAFPVALGDWKRGYLINDRLGIRVLRDPFTSKGNVLFYSTKRVGGGLLDSNAIRLLKIAA